MIESEVFPLHIAHSFAGRIKSNVDLIPCFVVHVRTNLFKLERANAAAIESLRVGDVEEVNRKVQRDGHFLKLAKSGRVFADRDFLKV